MPPPDFGLKNNTGRRGAATCGRLYPNAEGRPCAGAAQHERTHDQRLLEQAIAQQQHDRRPEPEHADRQAHDTEHAAAQHAVPRRDGCERDAGKRDQPARELLHRDDDRKSEPAKAQQQRADRRRPPNAHRITIAWTAPPTTPPPQRPGPAGWLQDAERIDVALYAAIAQTPTPTLDRAMARLSHAADYSRLSLASAAVLAATGGRRGRRAAANGLASVAVAASVINLAVKPLGHRRRPDRAAQEVPLARQVRMPSSTSFPSGHSAAAFAFATGVGHVLPPAAIPLRGLAALVAYSRVHTGVHYPGDVVAGALMGTTLAQITTHALDRYTARRR